MHLCCSGSHGSCYEWELEINPHDSKCCSQTFEFSGSSKHLLGDSAYQCAHRMKQCRLPMFSYTVTRTAISIEVFTNRNFHWGVTYIRSLKMQHYDCYLFAKIISTYLLSKGKHLKLKNSKIIRKDTPPDDIHASMIFRYNLFLFKDL